MSDEQKKIFGFLFANDAGNGAVKVKDGFRDMDAITRAGILQDWMSQLAELYDVAYREAHPDVASGERE